MTNDIMNEQRVSKLREFLDADPEDSFSRFALALEYLKGGDIKTAQSYFEYIRDNDPGYVGVYYHLGLLYQESGELVKAQKTFVTGISAAREAREYRAASELEQALNEIEPDQI